MNRQRVVKESPEKWSEKEDATENTIMKGKNDVRREPARERREEMEKMREIGGGGREETREEWTLRGEEERRGGGVEGRRGGKGRGG